MNDFEDALQTFSVQRHHGTKKFFRSLAGPTRRLCRVEPGEQLLDSVGHCRDARSHLG